jgi:hypothetical protein
LSGDRWVGAPRDERAASIAIGSVNPEGRAVARPSCLTLGLTSVGSAKEKGVFCQQLPLADHRDSNSLRGAKEPNSSTKSIGGKVTGVRGGKDLFVVRLFPDEEPHPCSCHAPASSRLRVALCLFKREPTKDRHQLVC